MILKGFELKSIFYFFFISFFVKLKCYADDQGVATLDGSSVSEFRGYPKREHSLIKPYQGAAMEIPYWEIMGSTMVSQNQIRLTSDIQSLKGAIWNKMPVQATDWELQVEFRVHSPNGQLFGDGMAIWYVQEPYQLGEVFGSKDYFRGLGIFLDTYSNHNGPHSHSHPYISAMLSNGSLHYDHDSDGTHTSLGGSHSGCEAKFRNKDYTTQVLIRYVGDTLSIYTDVQNVGVWQKCLSVDGVRLPTNYYFGLSAMTGELSDNHDVVSVRMYQQEYARVERPDESKNRDNIDPYAQAVEPPRDRVDDAKPSKLGWFGTIVFLVIGTSAVIAVIVFSVMYFQKSQERARKRFY